MWYLCKSMKKTKYTIARCLCCSFMIASLLLSCLLQVQGCPHWQAGLQLLLCSDILLERNNFFPPLLALHAALVQ
uniref:Putative secreted protein n=1 Tax=Ixodes ricinus TaxID=34613 RepID=A0A6B0U3A8_IXORI